MHSAKSVFLIEPPLFVPGSLRIMLLLSPKPLKSLGDLHDVMLISGVRGIKNITEYLEDNFSTLDYSLCIFLLFSFIK